MSRFKVSEVIGSERIDIEALVGPDSGSSLEYTSLAYMAGTFAEKLAEHARVFLIKWEGHPSPSGANIAGWIIHSYSHGMVRFCNGAPHAVCDVIERDGGAGRNQQQLVVYLYAEDKPPSNLPAPRDWLRGMEPAPGLRIYSMAEMLSLKLDGRYVIRVKDPDLEGEQYAKVRLNSEDPYMLQGVSMDMELLAPDFCHRSLKLWDPCFERGVSVWFVGPKEASGRVFSYDH